MLRSVVPANPAAFLNKSDSQRKRFGGYIPIGKSPEHGFIFFILFTYSFSNFKIASLIFLFTLSTTLIVFFYTNLQLFHQNIYDTINILDC